MKYYIGIDLGGTNIVAGLVDENYQILKKVSRKTNRPRPAEEIAADMAACALDAIKEAGLTKDQVEWIGIGTPGIANAATGIIEYSNNLDFHNVPMVKWISEATGLPAFVENDANAAAYGEYVAGAAKGATNAVCITLGTGVGGGVCNEGDALLLPMKELVAKEIYTKNSEKNTEIVIAKLGNDAGIIGAAFLGKAV